MLGVNWSSYRVVPWREGQPREWSERWLLSTNSVLEDFTEAAALVS